MCRDHPGGLVSEKNLYLILDYRLPDTVDRELVEMAYESEDCRQIVSTCQISPTISPATFPGRS